MSEPGVGPLLLLVVCGSFVLTVAIVVGVVWAAVRVARSRRERTQSRWQTAARALRLSDRGGRHARVLGGVRDGVEVEIAIDVFANAGAELVLLALGADDPQPQRWVTSAEARIHPPLPVALAVLDTRSLRGLDPIGASIAGADNPVADTVHRVTSDDPERTIAMLVALGRAPYEAIEGRGWRVSFDSVRVRLERDGAIDDPATLDDGLTLALRLVARLRESASPSSGPHR